MKRSLVVIEHRGGVVGPGQLAVVSKALEVSERVDAVAFGSDAVALAAVLARHGVTMLHVAAGELHGQALAQPRLDAVARLVQQEGYAAVFLENSSLAADIAGGAAARLEAGVNWDLQDVWIVDGELVGSRLALLDTAVVEVGWVGGTRIAVFRAGQLEPSTVAEVVPVEVRPLPDEIGERASAVRVVSQADGGTVQSGLESADVIVAGGRGLGGPEAIVLLEELAGALGGVVGVSLPVVDKGWYPYAHQVGQTGRKVRPRLYIACGISGAIHHRVGMSKSGTIVAINTDPQAPVFGICDFGVVGDLKDVLPRLTELVRAAPPVSSRDVHPGAAVGRVEHGLGDDGGAKSIREAW
jgi:electron transfer flavoprotein alpha subunit